MVGVGRTSVRLSYDVNEDFDLDFFGSFDMV